MHAVPSNCVAAAGYLTKLSYPRLADVDRDAADVKSLIDRSYSTLKDIIIDNPAEDQYIDDQVTFQKLFSDCSLTALAVLSIKMEIYEERIPDDVRKQFFWTAGQGRDRLRGWIESNNTEW